MTLQAHQISCVRGERLLFSGIDFTLQPGQALRVRGANGSGKTTLLRILCGLALAETGEVRWQSCNIRACREDYHRQLIYLGHVAAVKEDLLAWENLALGARLQGTVLERQSALRGLRALGLARAALLPARALSQGQRKRLVLARLHCAEGQAAALWILDEPFSALDQAAAAALCVTLDAHFARGGMLVYTTHQDFSLHPAQTQEINLDLPC